MAERQRSTDSRSEQRSQSPHRRDAYDAIAELEKFRVVDKYALDDNLEEQPDIFYRVSKAYAIALSQADIAKAAIEELEASLDAEVRIDMERSGEKVTETSVRQAVKGHPAMRTAVSEHLERREIAGRWGALKDTMTQRSYVMKELVSLFTVGYFSDAVGGKARADVRDNADRRAGEGRTRALEERGSSPPSGRSRSRED